MATPDDQTILETDLASLLEDEPEEAITDTDVDHKKEVGNYAIVGMLRYTQGHPVYRAVHQILGKIAAFYMVPKSDTKAISWLQRYINVLGKIEGYGVPALFDADETDDEQVLAITHVDGPSLRTVVNSGGPLLLHNVVGLLRQLLGIFDRAHRNGVILRDVHPDKICLYDDGSGRERVQMQDLSSAAFLTTAASEVGRGLWKRGRFQVRPADQAYVPPEILAGAPLDIHSDLYMLGILAAELLTGGVPRRRPKVGTQWGTGLQEFLSRLLAKDPKERFASAALAWRHLEDIVLPQVLRFRGSDWGMGILERWSRRLRHNFLMTSQSGSAVLPALDIRMPDDPENEED